MGALIQSLKGEQDLFPRKLMEILLQNTNFNLLITI
jgi:hypothetical protein